MILGLITLALIGLRLGDLSHWHSGNNGGQTQDEAESLTKFLTTRSSAE